MKLFHQQYQKKSHVRRGWGWLLLFSFSVTLAGCANRIPAPCFKDGREYCVTDEWIFSEAWYSCYLRGISCSQGGCWENARDEFLRSVRTRDQDERWARTYGMHRLPEYFPNRELGIAYYHLGDLDQALEYLTLSLEQCESAKTKHYLNKVRKEKLLLTRQDKLPPHLTLDAYPQITASPEFVLTGAAQDDTFVANIIIQVNNEKPLALLELSRPIFSAFHLKLSLQPGINHVSAKVVDLLGKEEEQIIKVLLDQEGPTIYFDQTEADNAITPVAIKGVLYDPSGVSRFYLNGKKMSLRTIGIEKNADSDNSLFPSAYLFHYPLSPEEQMKGVFHYRAEDILHNKTIGSVSFGSGEQKFYDQRASYRRPGEVRIAMASHSAAKDLSSVLPICRLANRRTPDPVIIQIEPIPEETFQEEICLHISISTHCRIEEISVNGQPILSMYGLDWIKRFNRIKEKFLSKKADGRFLFQRIVELKEGENEVHLWVKDESGGMWEKIIEIRKKTKKIHSLQERWRMAIPFIIFTQEKENREQKKKELTYQLMETFIAQERFKVIDLENLPVIIDEKNLCHYLGKPFLGHPSELRVWIDTFLLGYLQEAQDSLALSASLIDLETGEILATKDVCEEIDSSQLVWQEGRREHAFQICSVLAAKFKEHFPLCEGKVISLTNEEMKTGIGAIDGLKKGMKLLVYNQEDKQDVDYSLLTEAKVKEVRKDYSLARLLEYGEKDFEEVCTNWGVITR